MPQRRPWIALALLAFALPAGALDDALYAEVLSRYTHEVRDLARTRVAYRELGSAPEWRRVVDSLEATDPSRLGTRKAKLAFWIDAYNVLAIDLIVRNHPLESIRDLGSLIWPVWKRTAGTIGGESYSLDRIELAVDHRRVLEGHIAEVPVSLAIVGLGQADLLLDHAKVRDEEIAIARDRLLHRPPPRPGGQGRCRMPDAG